MNHYASSDGAGFWHQPSKRNEASRSSTATAVTSLVRSRKWLSEDRRLGETKRIAEQLLRAVFDHANRLCEERSDEAIQ